MSKENSITGVITITTTFHRHYLSQKATMKLSYQKQYHYELNMLDKFWTKLDLIDDFFAVMAVGIMQ